MNLNQTCWATSFALGALFSVACGSNNPSSASAGGSANASSGGSTAGGTQAAPDPCSLITDTQAATLFGGPVSHVTASSLDANNGSGPVTENRCNYDLITSNQQGYDLWVAVYAGADRAYFDAAMDHSPAIPGLGDAAFGDSIHVYVISKGIVLQLYGSLPGENGLQQAARLAIAGL